MIAGLLERLRDPFGEIPPDHWALTRNQWISARYGLWYLHHPRLFKWAGAAAFASHRVGILLALYDLAGEVDRILGRSRITKARWLEKKPEEDKDWDPSDSERAYVLELLRLGNERVFADIGWAHDAYVEGGLDAIRARVDADPAKAPVLDAFTRIDGAEKVLRQTASNKPEYGQAIDSIWDANLMLLRHEQKDILQPCFDQMPAGTARNVLSKLAWMDFAMERVSELRDFLDAGALGDFLAGVRRHPEATDFSEFTERVAAGVVPDFTDFDQRWRWIDEKVWPLWKAVSVRDKEMSDKLRKLVSRPLLPAAGAG